MGAGRQSGLRRRGSRSGPSLGRRPLTCPGAGFPTRVPTACEPRPAAFTVGNAEPHLCCDTRQLLDHRLRGSAPESERSCGLRTCRPRKTHRQRVSLVVSGFAWAELAVEINALRRVRGRRGSDRGLPETKPRPPWRPLPHRLRRQRLSGTLKIANRAYRDPLRPETHERTRELTTIDGLWVGWNCCAPAAPRSTN